MTDRTMPPERLDALEASVFRETQRVPHKATYGITLGDCLALIAMAKRTEAAEHRAMDMERLSRYETDLREQAERERGALWTALAEILHIINGDNGECYRDDPEAVHSISKVAYRALAQPTDAGGA